MTTKTTQEKFKEQFQDIFRPHFLEKGEASGTRLLVNLEEALMGFVESQEKEAERRGVQKCIEIIGCRAITAQASSDPRELHLNETLNQIIVQLHTHNTPTK